MKLRRLYDAEHTLWSICQAWGYTLTDEKAYDLAIAHFHKYDPNLIEDLDDDSPELEIETGYPPVGEKK